MVDNEKSCKILSFVGPSLPTETEQEDFRYEPDPKDPHRVIRIGRNGLKTWGRWVDQKFVPMNMKPDK